MYKIMAILIESPTSAKYFKDSDMIKYNGNHAHNCHTWYAAGASGDCLDFKLVLRLIQYLQHLLPLLFANTLQRLGQGATDLNIIHIELVCIAIRLNIQPTNNN